MIPYVRNSLVAHDSELVAKVIRVRAHASAGHVVVAERLGNEALHALDLLDVLVSVQGGGDARVVTAVDV